MKWSLAYLILLLMPIVGFAQTDSSLLQDGMKAYQQGDYDTAISKLKTATETVASSEDKASAHLALGIIYQLLNDEDQARKNPRCDRQGRCREVHRDVRPHWQSPDAQGHRWAHGGNQGDGGRGATGHEGGCGWCGRETRNRCGQVPRAGHC